MTYQLDCHQILGFLEMSLIFFRSSLKMNNWAYQWKMSFNPDPSKQAQKAIFSRKINKPSNPEL